MQANFLPISTLNDLDKICNKFLWGESEGKRKLHLVSKECTFRPKEMGGLGIRDHRTVNTLLMAKLGWKLCQGPPNLAQECIKSKYIHQNRVTKFQNGSQVWQSVGKGWPLLEASCQWSLGDGKTASFWYDDWLGCGPVRNLVIGPLTLGDQDIRVLDVWNNGEWNGGDLSIDIPLEVRERLKSYEWSPHLDPDTPYSSFVHKRSFSMKKAYFYTMSKKVTTFENMNWIWKGSFSPKIKFFIWLVWLDRLPTSNMLHIRKIIPSPICPLCNLQVEDALHALRDCPYAQSIWVLTNNQGPTHADLHSWIESNLQSQDKYKGLSWKILFPFICHGIWVSRNKKIFENTTQPKPDHLLKIAVSHAGEFLASLPAKMETSSNSTYCSLPSIVPNHWVLVQVDASYTGAHNHSGLGGWLRNNQDIWLAGFQKKVYAADVLMAELLGIIEGLALAKRGGFDYVLILSDSLQAINLISCDKIFNDVYCNVLKKCRACKQEFKDIQFTFVKREKNKVADFLARDCRRDVRNLNVVRDLPLPPTECMNLLLTDCCRLPGQNSG